MTTTFEVEIRVSGEWQTVKVARCPFKALELATAYAAGHEGRAASVFRVDRDAAGDRCGQREIFHGWNG